jgi:hypothetical protein
MALRGWDGSVRFRPGGPEASVDEARVSFQPSGYRHNRSPKLSPWRCPRSKKTSGARTQNNLSDQAGLFTFECFMPASKRAGCRFSLHTMLERES